MTIIYLLTDTQAQVAAPKAPCGRSCHLLVGAGTAFQWSRERQRKPRGTQLGRGSHSQTRQEFPPPNDHCAQVDSAEHQLSSLAVSTCPPLSQGELRHLPSHTRVLTAATRYPWPCLGVESFSIRGRVWGWSLSVSVAMFRGLCRCHQVKMRSPGRA